MAASTASSSVVSNLSTTTLSDKPGDDTRADIVSAIGTAPPTDAVAAAAATGVGERRRCPEKVSFDPERMSAGVEKTSSREAMVTPNTKVAVRQRRTQGLPAWLSG